MEQSLPCFAAQRWRARPVASVSLLPQATLQTSNAPAFQQAMAMWALTSEAQRAAFSAVLRSSASFSNPRLMSAKTQVRGWAARAEQVSNARAAMRGGTMRGQG